MKATRQEEELERLLKMIRPGDGAAKEEASRRWDSIAKPLHSRGKLERDIIRIAGIQRTAAVRLEKKALLVLCADNGVVEEGVTQTGQEVTAIVAENFLTGNTSAAIMAQKAGVDLFPIDMGMAADTQVPNYKVAYGTRNMAKEPAMTREQALQAVLTGIRLAKEKKEEGYDLLAVGEMGIGNTTTSSAVSSLLLGREIQEMTGRGAGLTSQGLERKIRVIREAIRRNRPDPSDSLDVLAKVGGFDLAGLAGVCLGGAVYGIPVVLDGFISGAAALAAVRLCPTVREYLIASHVSKEPGMRAILTELGLEAALDCGLCLGEGTGALLYLPALLMAQEVYRSMSTFSENQIEEYQELT